MSDPIEIPPEGNSDHLVEPPIVDSLQTDRQRGEWAISFVPEDSASSREKEIVAVPFRSPEGHRIQLRMDRLDRLLGGRVERIFHAGEGNFTFHMEDGRTRQLAEAHGQLDLPMRAYVEIADIAMTAQIVFLMAHSPA